MKNSKEFLSKRYTATGLKIRLNYLRYKVCRIKQ